jgi:uncharacterized membrane protein HdeD (DUF308 family)
MNKLNDLRFIIGLFFLIVGLLLLVYYFFFTKAAARINVVCGYIFCLFGIFMIIASGKILRGK